MRLEQVARGNSAELYAALLTWRLLTLELTQNILQNSPGSLLNRTLVLPD